MTRICCPVIVTFKATGNAPRLGEKFSKLKFKASVTLDVSCCLTLWVLLCSLADRWVGDKVLADHLKKLFKEKAASLVWPVHSATQMM